MMTSEPVTPEGLPPKQTPTQGSPPGATTPLPSEARPKPTRSGVVWVAVVIALVLLVLHPAEPGARQGNVPRPRGHALPGHGPVHRQRRRGHSRSRCRRGKDHPAPLQRPQGSDAAQAGLTAALEDDQRRWTSDARPFTISGPRHKWTPPEEAGRGLIQPAPSMSASTFSDTLNVCGTRANRGAAASVRGCPRCLLPQRSTLDPTHAHRAPGPALNGLPVRAPCLTRLPASLVFAG